MLNLLGVISKSTCYPDKVVPLVVLRHSEKGLSFDVEVCYKHLYLQDNMETVENKRDYLKHLHVKLLNTQINKYSLIVSCISTFLNDSIACSSVGLG